MSKGGRDSLSRKSGNAAGEEISRGARISVFVERQRDGASSVRKRASVSLGRPKKETLPEPALKGGRASVSRLRVELEHEKTWRPPSNDREIHVVARRTSSDLHRWKVRRCCGLKTFG
jgi:hypothetical protein